MDPNANIAEQLDAAQAILAGADGTMTADEEHAAATALAELVLALDEWRRKGGFDPYDKHAITYEYALVVFRDLCEPLDEAEGGEYLRGGVNLLADLFGQPDQDTGTRMDEIEADLRRLPAFADPADLAKHGVERYVRQPYDGAPDNEPSPDPDWMNP